ncbi:MAG: ASKHA domain-containing protein [Treponema sp.]|nr:ASKHA domain-containing protein [Treponema sp.]
MPWVTFINEKTRIEVTAGVSILEAARSAGLVLETPCGGRGTCGKCGVKIARPEQLAHISSGGHAVSGTGANRDFVPACQSCIHGDIEVQIQDYAEANRSLRILTAGEDFSCPNSPYITKRPAGAYTEVYGGGRFLGKEPGNTPGLIYGAAIDIGTTTIVSSLVDLATGEKIAAASRLNPQAAYAQDVLSRILFCRTDKGLETLHGIFIEALTAMISAMAAEAGVRTEHIYELVYSGNTAMLHLACGIDPLSLGQYPFTPRLWGGNQIPAGGLGISGFGCVYIPPIISAYVGADITAGILVSRLDEVPGTTVFIDVGTNGELVLARNGRLAAASTAAGPAFEGMNISCGMRASRGALESFRINADGECSYQVIGGGETGEQGEAGEVLGICGSGLLDITGELVRTGVIGASGRFSGREQEGGALHKRLGTKDGKNAFFITPKVCLTQQDVRQLQLAKGAIRAGIETLLAHFHISAADVDTVRIAGAFGYHLNEESLINTGLLPPAFRGKVEFAGNTSLSGAAAFLLNTGLREKMERLVKNVDTVDLAKDPRFETFFIRYLDFDPEESAGDGLTSPIVKNHNSREVVQRPELPDN